MKYHIAFEGIDGSGKSTLVKNLGEKLRKHGYEVVVDVDRPVMKETMGTDYEVLEKYFDIDNPDVNFFLYAGLALTELMRDRKSIPEDAILLSDRDIASMYIYSSLEKYQFLPLKAYMKIVKLIYKTFPKPDVTFFINVPMEVIRERVENRKKNEDYYAVKMNDWWTNLYQSYQKWFKKNRGKNLIEVESGNPQFVEETVIFELRRRGINV